MTTTAEVPYRDTLPIVPTDDVTIDSLKAEAAALGDRFPEVVAHIADLIADAEEMLQGRADLDDLMARSFPVTAGLFRRIELLHGTLAPLAAESARHVELGKALTDEAEAARVRLLDIRAQLAALAKAAGLPATLFSLATRKTTRLNVVMMKMDAVLENVRHFQARLPDPTRVNALVVEARAVMDQQKQSRRKSRLMHAERTVDGREQERYERLLLDALVYLSAQGLAAYPGDVVRERRYRLDHVYGRKASRVGDPGAGAANGVPDAAGPGDDEG